MACRFNASRGRMSRKNFVPDGCTDLYENPYSLELTGLIPPYPPSPSVRPVLQSGRAFFLKSLAIERCCFRKIEHRNGGIQYGRKLFSSPGRGI
ncbi:hypothetical protein VTK26DRAFT_5631 [Humicola hyalothermophila]